MTQLATQSPEVRWAIQSDARIAMSRMPLASLTICYEMTYLIVRQLTLAFGRRVGHAHHHVVGLVEGQFLRKSWNDRAHHRVHVSITSGISWAIPCIAHLVPVRVEHCPRLRIVLQLLIRFVVKVAITDVDNDLVRFADKILMAWIVQPLLKYASVSSAPVCPSNGMKHEPRPGSRGWARAPDGRGADVAGSWTDAT